jgi:hypothetical protein
VAANRRRIALHSCFYYSSDAIHAYSSVVSREVRRIRYLANNAAIIAFLRKRGYDVLNLIEVRRKYAGECISGDVMVGSERFRY